MRKKQVNPNALSGREKTAYYAGMAGQNVIYAIIGTALVGYYWANVIFLPALAVTVISVIARVWDAINDPMMGTIVDKTKSKWGKCRPYLIIMPILIGAMTIGCYLNGRYSASNTVVENVFIIGWAAVSYIAWGMMYTAADIPIWSLPALMTGKEKERDTLLSIARIFAAVGGAVGMIAIPLAQAVAGPGASPAQMQMGFIVTAVVLTIIGTILFQMTGIFCKERIVQSDKRRTMKESFKLMWTNKPFRRILISGVIRSPFQLIMLIAMPLLSYYFSNNQSPFSDIKIVLAYVLLAGGIFGGQFLASALAPKIGAKYEKRRVFNVFNIASGIAFALIFIVFLIFPTKLNEIPLLVLLAFCFFLCGAGMGAVQVIQSLMIADCIDYEEYNTGSRPDGVFFAGQSFITKISGGIASLVMGIAYTIVGFSADNIESLNMGLSDGILDFKVDAPLYAWIMFFLIAVPTAIGMLLSVIPMLKYELTDKQHAEILDELNKRRPIITEEEVAEILADKADGEAIEAEENMSEVEADESVEDVAKTDEAENADVSDEATPAEDSEDKGE